MWGLIIGVPLFVLVKLLTWYYTAEIAIRILWGQADPTAINLDPFAAHARQR
jgi:hypothetical protein